MWTTSANVFRRCFHPSGRPEALTAATRRTFFGPGTAPACSRATVEDGRGLLGCGSRRCDAVYGIGNCEGTARIRRDRVRAGSHRCKAADRRDHSPDRAHLLPGAGAHYSRVRAAVSGGVLHDLARRAAGIDHRVWRSDAVASWTGPADRARLVDIDSLCGVAARCTAGVR